MALHLRRPRRGGAGSEGGDLAWRFAHQSGAGVERPAADLLLYRGVKAPISEPRSRSDAARFWLNAIGVAPGKTPVGRKDIWLKSSDLSAITDGRMSGEAATNMAKILGDNTKISQAYALPFERAMADLYQRHMLSEAARIWWESFVATGGNEGENASQLRAV